MPKISKIKPGPQCPDSIYPGTQISSPRINWVGTRAVKKGTQLTGYPH